LIKKKRRKKYKKVKFFLESGLKCQGKKEVRYIKELKRYKKDLPSKAARIKTDIGDYTPDFEFPDKYIEIKSLHTFSVLLGNIAYLPGGPVSDLQLRKIFLVAENIKPVDIIVYLSRDQYLPQEESNWPNHINVTLIFKGGKRKIKDKKS
jgi:hypothetical protein